MRQIKSTLSIDKVLVEISIKRYFLQQAFVQVPLAQSLFASFAQCPFEHSPLPTLVHSHLEHCVANVFLKAEESEFLFCNKVALATLENHKLVLDKSLVGKVWIARQIDHDTILVEWVDLKNYSKGTAKSKQRDAPEGRVSA